MDTSLLLTQIVGVVLTLIGLGVLINSDFYAKNFSGFFKDVPLEFMSALTMQVLGLLIVLTHNVWEMSGAVIVTLVGWALLVKGAVWMVCPRSLAKIFKLFQKNLKTLMTIDGVVLLVAGLYLVYQGFFM